jgi:hypothetical protein
MRQAIEFLGMLCVFLGSCRCLFVDSTIVSSVLTAVSSVFPAQTRRGIEDELTLAVGTYVVADREAWQD